jgi:mono/diheme cytochrome c family protein
VAAKRIESGFHAASGGFRRLAVSGARPLGRRPDSFPGPGMCHASGDHRFAGDIRMKGKVIGLCCALLALPALPVHAADTTSSYKVADGNKVDANTLNGWKTWRALACERCHGAKQEGMVGPSLIDALKTLDKDEFHRTVFGGRVEKGMPDFSSSKMMQDNWQNLYAYLKGRSDGKIQPGHLYPMDGAK